MSIFERGLSASVSFAGSYLGFADRDEALKMAAAPSLTQAPISRAKGLPGVTERECTRLDRMLPGMRAQGLFPQGQALFCGAADATSSAYRDYMVDLGGNLVIADDPATQVAWIKRHMDEIDYVLLDVEFYGDIDDAIELALEIRSLAPTLPILLVSRNVGGDDFTSERMMICDATLKAPFRQPVLRRALQAAVANNGYYNQSRGLRYS